MRIFSKGWRGEKAAQFHMMWSLDTSYIVFNDLIIESSTGTTQIDHVVLSPFGIFVIETKNMSGWIFGNEKVKEWTQVIYKRKYKFQNPIHQNYRHIAVLSSVLELNMSHFHSIIYFSGGVTFKTPMPENVLIFRLCEYIKRFDRVILQQSQIVSIGSKLKYLKATSPDHRSHVKNIRERHSSTEICPKCGGKLVLRTARNGKYAGNKFLGCLNYPKCNYIKNIK